MATKKLSNHWSLGLLKTMQDPDQVVYEDNLVVAIKDKYPKATFHYLVCPKEDIKSIRHVNHTHLSLLKHMHEVAEQLAVKQEDYKFLFGYHAVPSMQRLHLHVISDDLNSSYMKTRQHWNSFTTKFFMQSDLLIKELELNKEIKIPNYSKVNSMELKCLKCDYIATKMSDMKKHNLKHVQDAG